MLEHVTKRTPVGSVAAALGALWISTAVWAGVAENLAGADRPAEDIARDASRKPAEVLSFLGLEPGMTAIDVLAAGGWYTEVLAHAVGPDGTVYAQNPATMLQFRDGANDKAITKRLADGRLANVERLDRELGDLGIAPESVDVAITALNFHDIYNSAGAAAAGAFLENVYAVLKPGGVFGIIDHVGIEGQDNQRLHRMDLAAAREVIAASPFELEAESDVLHNPADDHTKGVFDRSLARDTDRFVFRLRKPR